MSKDTGFEKKFIYIQPLNLYFSKEKISFGTGWHGTHKLLQNQESRMPTIPEFIGYLKYLKDSKDKEEIEIYRKIVEPGLHFRGELLDATFEIKNKKLHINYNHIIDKEGKLVPKNSEPLEEDTLMQDLKPGISLDDWITNPTKQGLPKKDCKRGNIYYWHPRSYNNSVVRFAANSVWTYLSCGANAYNPNLKVSVVKEANYFK